MDLPREVRPVAADFALPLQAAFGGGLRVRANTWLAISRPAAAQRSRINGPSATPQKIAQQELFRSDEVISAATGIDQAQLYSRRTVDPCRTSTAPTESIAHPNHRGGRTVFGVVEVGIPDIIIES